MSSLIRQCPDPDPSVRGLAHSLLTPWGSGALSHHLVIGCCCWLVGHSIVPAPLSFFQESLLPVVLKPLFVSPLNPPNNKSPQWACQPPCSVQKRREPQGKGERDEKEETTVATHTWLHVSYAPALTAVCLMCSVSLVLLWVWERSTLHVYEEMLYWEGSKGKCKAGKFTREAQESSLTWLSHCGQIKSAFPASYDIRACVYRRVSVPLELLWSSYCYSPHICKDGCSKRVIRKTQQIGNIHARNGGWGFLGNAFLPLQRIPGEEIACCALPCLKGKNINMRGWACIFNV